MPRRYHYHYHWLPSVEHLTRHPPPCNAPHCEIGETIADTIHGMAVVGLCPECHGDGIDPAPQCGYCGCGLEPGHGPIGALVQGSYGHYHKWTYLLCGPCAWRATINGDEGSSVETSEPVE